VTWQEALKRAAEGGCPLLVRDIVDGDIGIDTYGYDERTKSHYIQPYAPLEVEVEVEVTKSGKVLALTIVMVALAHFYRKSTNSSLKEYGRFDEEIRVLELRRAELEKKLR
jgi:hypothetical protein